jgi:hypothetical protein
VAVTTHVHLAPRLKKEYNYNLRLLFAFMAGYRVKLITTVKVKQPYYRPGQTLRAPGG